MRRPRRQGMAIFIVFMVIAVISVFTSIVVFQSKSTRQMGEEKRDRAQARFLALGAASHFLLKFKLLPAELYDAVSYSVGRNPFFDFSIPVTSTSGSTFTPAANVQAEFGPMFFTGSNPGGITDNGGNPRRIVVNRSIEGNNIYSNGSAGFFGSDNQNRMAYLLNHYMLDITTEFPAAGENGIVVVSSNFHQDVALMGVADSTANFSALGRTPWRDPFTGSYFVRSVKLLGTGGATVGTAGAKYQADSILFTSEATILRDRQISVVNRNPDGTPKALLIQRRSRANLTAGQGWLQLRENRETDGDFQQRTNSSLNPTSGRRTEVATAVYFVTRTGR